MSIVSSLFCTASILTGVHHNWRHRQQLGTDVETRTRVDADFRIAVSSAQLALPIIAVT